MIITQRRCTKHPSSESWSILDARPLSYVSVDVDSEHAITSFTFLIGSSSNEPVADKSMTQISTDEPIGERRRLVLAAFSKRIPTDSYPQKTQPQTQNLKVLVFIADGTISNKK